MRHNQDQSRRESMRRIHIGMGGLAAVVLLVSLTSIVIDAVRRDDSAATTAIAVEPPVPEVMANVAAPAAPSEPLADLGVAPVAEGGVATSAPAVVPDLKPDPELQKPMDRDPGPGAGTGGSPGAGRQ